MKYWLYIVILLSAGRFYSQTLKARVEPVTRLVGEPFVLTLTITSNNEDSIDYSPFNDIIHCYIKNSMASQTRGEQIDIEQLAFRDTTYKKGDIYFWEGKYEMTAWDSGTVIIPGSEILINDSLMYFPEAAVRFDLVPKIDNQDIYDIREFQSDIPAKKTLWDRYLENWWWTVPASLLLIFIGVQLIRYLSSKRKTNHEVRIEMSLKEKTLLALDHLESQRLWENEDLKSHFTQLTHIIRSYLSGRYSVNFLEKTSWETREILLRMQVDEETVKGLNQLLNTSDMIKFAQSTTDEFTVLKFGSLAKRLVIETSPIETIQRAN